MRSLDTLLLAIQTAGWTVLAVWMLAQVPALVRERDWPLLSLAGIYLGMAVILAAVLWPTLLSR